VVLVVVEIVVVVVVRGGRGWEWIAMGIEVDRFRGRDDDPFPDMTFGKGRRIGESGSDMTDVFCLS